MKKSQAIAFDASNRLVIVHRAAKCFHWAFSIDGAPGGLAYFTRRGAVKAARKAAAAWRENGA